MVNKFKYLIVSNSYNPNVGGVVVLHRLCHEINKLGLVARMVPAYSSYVLSKDDWVVPLLRFVKERLRRVGKYEINSDLDTPLWIEREFRESLDEWVVVYPETISGNPLGAKNVVRWFLHHPGYHRGSFFYGPGELYFRYHPGINVPKILQSSTSESGLHIVHYPLDLYSQVDAKPVRKGTAYAIRKGVGKKIVHDLSDSILIDGKSHEEIAKIFKSVVTFYSYDPYTAYSFFAALCGCNSVVVPDENVSIEDWYPDPNFRLGLAYGIEGVSEAKQQHQALLARMKNEMLANVNNVNSFCERVESYFGIGR